MRDDGHGDDEDDVWCMMTIMIWMMLAITLMRIHEYH